MRGKYGSTHSKYISSLNLLKKPVPLPPTSPCPLTALVSLLASCLPPAPFLPSSSFFRISSSTANSNPSNHFSLAFSSPVPFHISHISLNSPTRSLALSAPPPRPSASVSKSRTSWRSRESAAWPLLSRSGS